ncbi:MAG: hypothetical protein ACUVVU_05805 [Tepidimonas sp.]
MKNPSAARLVWPEGAHDEPGWNQPVMVVVVLGAARVPGTAEAAAASV